MFFCALSINAQRKSLGNNVYGEVNSNGVLVISGSGEIVKYVVIKFKGLDSSRNPHAQKIKEVIIEEGVTSIGESAFYSCDNLEGIQIPNTVKRIEDDAFRSCRGMKSIIIPNSVTSIGANAFFGCSRLKTIVVPNSVKSIGESAFGHCLGLESISIPNSVISIGDGLVYGCNSIYSWKGKILSMPTSIVEAGSSKWKDLYISDDSMNAYIEDQRNQNLFGTIKEGRKITKISGGYLVEDEGKKGIVKDDKSWAVPLSPLWTKFIDMVLVNDKYVKVKSSNGYGMMTPEGRTIVSEKQGYSNIELFSNVNVDYFKISKNGYYGLVDINGNEIIPLEVEALEQSGKGFMRFKINGFWGVMNYTGKIIIPTDRGYTSIGNFVTLTKRFPYTMNGYKGECDINGRPISKIKVNTPQQTIVKQETQQDKKEKEKIIIIEPEPTPQPKPNLQPMTEWVPCGACGHNPGVCQTCVGMGETASGRRCISCRGTGKCHFCNGQGGRYQTVYR